MKIGAVIDDPLVDLKGNKVGVQRASTYDRYATDDVAPASAEIVRYSSQNEIFLDLAAGRVDATLADIVNIDDGFIKTDAGKGFALVSPDFNEQKYFGDGSGIAVRKGDKALADKISAVILVIRANGTFKEVQDTYCDFNVYGD
jgi:arginine/ornithine transport system substrate-binding protein